MTKPSTAECQNWAGTVIDQTIIDDLIRLELFELIKGKATKYPVPYKSGAVDEFVFKIKQGPLNEMALENLLNGIDWVFSMDNKSIEHENTRLKICNTKKFIIDTKDEE